MPAARYAARYLGNDLHVDFTVRVAVSAASKYSGATTVQVYARRIAERAPLRQLVALQKRVSSPLAVTRTSLSYSMQKILLITHFAHFATLTMKQVLDLRLLPVRLSS